MSKLGYLDIAMNRMHRWVDYQILYGHHPMPELKFGHRLAHEDDRPKNEEGLDKLEEVMPEDIRRYFSLLSRAQQEDQKIVASTKAKETFQDEMDKILVKVTQTGPPMVAQMPNGDTYVMYREAISDTPVVEKASVVRL